MWRTYIYIYIRQLVFWHCSEEFYLRFVWMREFYWTYQFMRWNKEISWICGHKNQFVTILNDGYFYACAKYRSKIAFNKVEKCWKKVVAFFFYPKIQSQHFLWNPKLKIFQINLSHHFSEIVGWIKLQRFYVGLKLIPKIKPMFHWMQSFCRSVYIYVRFICLGCSVPVGRMATTFDELFLTFTDSNRAVVSWSYRTHWLYI